MSNNSIRDRLISLGPEQLADALLRLATGNGEVDRVVKRMTALPSETVSAFKSKLIALKKARRFIDWRGASDFAVELDLMLDDLKAGCDDPKIGLEQVIAFFEADELIFEQCDDSGGYVGTVYQCSACDLFVHYASGYTDKVHLIDRLIKLCESDEYGVRGDLINTAHRFLSKDMLRIFADQLKKISREQNDAFRWSRALASIARQLKDAPMYEEALRMTRHGLNPRLYPDVARAYFEAGDPETALSWLERAASETSGSYGNDDLLLRVYTEIGNTEKAEETAWRIFHSYRSQENLAKLLSVIGEDQRRQVVKDEVASILNSSCYNDFDAQFLISVGCLDEAKQYLIDHVDKLDGSNYAWLLPMAEAMEKSGHYLAATLIYRALLDSILARGVSKYYHHGNRYLAKLDLLNGSVGDWGRFPDHEAYKALLREVHKRKSAFWSGYANK